MATAQVTPQPTEWDTQGNPVAPSGTAAAPTEWDAQGNPVTPAPTPQQAGHSNPSFTGLTAPVVHSNPTFDATKGTDSGAGFQQAAGDVWNSIKGTPSSIWHSLPPVELADSTKQTLSVINAYEKARSSGGSVSDAIMAADTQARQQDHVSAAVQQRVADFKKNPTQATARALGDAGALVASMFGGGAEASEGLIGGEAGEGMAAAADATPKDPGVLSKLVKGEGSAQPQAQAAVRGGAQSAADDSGIAATMDPKAGVRTLADDTIGQVATKERATYDAVNDAAEIDMKALYDYREKLTDALDNPANVANEDALQAKLKTTQDAIDKGEATAQTKGVSPDTLSKAQQLTQQRYAVQDFKAKFLNNESVVTGNVAHGAEESINVNAAIKAAEKMNKPSKFAPEGTPTRLQQALGEDGASTLLKNLYQAQKTGASAAKVRKIVVGVLGTVGVAETIKSVLH